MPMEWPNESHTDLLPPMSSQDAAHQLNNLLTVILGSLEQLQRQALDERGAVQLQRARMALDQANGLLQGLAGPYGWRQHPAAACMEAHPAGRG